MLVKLYEPTTMDRGVLDCHRLIREHVDDPQLVRIVMGALTDKTILTQLYTGKNYTAMGYHAAMFGYLARIVQKGLMDTLDQMPSLKKTLDRIFTCIIDTFFVQGNDIVSNGCAISIIDLMENVFGEYLECEDQELYKCNFLLKTFFTPFLNIIQGGVGSTHAQVKSACFVLRKMTQHLIKNYPHTLTRELKDTLVQTIYRSRITESEYSLLVRDLIKFTEFNLTAVFNSKLKNMFEYSIYALNCLTNNSSGNSP
jgi:hypothetical protein